MTGVTGQTGAVGTIQNHGSDGSASARGSQTGGPPASGGLSGGGLAGGGPAAGGGPSGGVEPARAVRAPTPGRRALGKGLAVALVLVALAGLTWWRSGDQGITRLHACPAAAGAGASGDWTAAAKETSAKNLDIVPVPVGPLTAIVCRYTTEGGALVTAPRQVA